MSHSNKMILKLSISITVIAACLPFYANGQSMSEFEQWKKQYIGEFKQYKDEMDKEFADFLNQKWKAFETEKGSIRDKSPKPLKIPVAKVIDEPSPVKPPKTSRRGQKTGF